MEANFNHNNSKCRLLHLDCMSILSSFEDNQFDIAIVDPPYGIGENWRKSKRSSFYDYPHTFNDSRPQVEYWIELFRVSKEQIVWGCNYYWDFLPPSNNLIFWDKGINAKKHFASAGELAWTSFRKYPLLKYSFLWCGALKCEKTLKIHPHQKPVQLYYQCLTDFAQKGMNILDTHLGSGSSAIACAKYGDISFTGIEKDDVFFHAAVKRYEDFIKQESMFT